MTTSPPQQSLGRALMRMGLTTHVALYRWTGGAFGGTMGPNKILLLTTVGRKTGIVRTWPLVYAQDGDRYFIIASNGGAPRNPSWLLNLQGNPDTTVQIGRTIIKVHAETATGEERTRLWQELIVNSPQFAEYQRKTEREIPVVVLTPR